MKLFPDQSALDKILPELRDEYAVGVPRFSEEVLRQLEAGEDVLIDVVGHEGYVLNVQTLGIHKKWANHLGVPLVGRATKRGYLRISFSDLSKSQSMKHAVVKNTLFVNPDPKKFTTIEHLDCDPSSNLPTNLVFASVKFQNHRSNKKPNHKSNSEKTSRAIQQFTLDGVFVKEFESVTQAAIDVTGDVRQVSNISKCARGVCPNTSGYVWKYRTR